MKKQSGISLIEPLVSMVIVAIGLLGLAKFQSAVFQASEAARADSESWLCVKDRIENYRATGNLPVTTGILDAECREFLENFSIQSFLRSNSEVAFTNSNFAGIGSSGYKAGLLRPFDRTLDIPFPAVRVNDNQSDYVPPGSLGWRLSFDNETGRVTGVNSIEAAEGTGGLTLTGDYFVISGFVTTSNNAHPLTALNVAAIPSGSTAQAIDFANSSAPVLRTTGVQCIDDSTVISTQATLSNSTDNVSFALTGYTTVYDGMKIVFTGVPNGSNVDNNTVYYVRETSVSPNQVTFKISSTPDGETINVLRAGTDQYTIATGAEYNGFLTYTCVVQKNWAGKIEVRNNATAATKVCRYFNNGLEYITNVAQISASRVQSPNHGLVAGNLVQFADLDTASSGSLNNFTDYTVATADANSFSVTATTVPTTYTNVFYVFKSDATLNTPSFGAITKNLNNQNLTIVGSSASCPVIARSLPANNNQLPFKTVQHQPTP